MTKSNVCAGSLNLVTAILTTGSSYSAIVNRKPILKYSMQELMTQIETTDEIPANEVFCILYNAP